MINAIVVGAAGRMGRMIVNAVQNAEGITCTGAIETPGHPVLGQDAGIVAGVGELGVTIEDNLESIIKKGDVVIDFTAAEASLTLLFETLGGANLIHDVGYMESGKCHSLEMLAICDEVIGYIRRYCRGIEVNEETLALDLIAELGPEGDYLSSEHTINHYRETWYPRLFNRNHYDGWLAEDGQTLRRRSQKMVEEILESHTPEPLDGKIKKQIEAVLG